jgi:pimeloyl-ACP methyl ester carboxylesterase
MPTRVEPRRSAALQAARHVAGFAELVTHFGGEITALVQEVHGTSSPLARLTASPPARGIYGAVRLGFGGARRAATLGGRLAHREPVPDAGLDVQSAINGVFGHLLEEAGSAYALPMSLHADALLRRAERTVLFLHGLCMNERAFRQPAHVDFAAWARRHLGARIAYVRYNTGLHISHNGARLAQRIEQHALARDSELILVGHSMGGLVARSALQQAGERGDDWPRRVTHVACLGSPHEGAHLERLGNHANRMLAATPWTRPFMRLGNLRSDGIRDLRFGHLLEEDWRGRAADDPRRAHSAAGLASHVDHLLVAAALREVGRTDPLGDWLVPVESALARNLHPEGAVRRELIRGIGHLALLGDARVYRTLRSWLVDRR